MAAHKLPSLHNVSISAQPSIENAAYLTFKRSLSYFMDAPEGQSNIAEHLVHDLNSLFAALLLPLKVTTPYDLTPSLLLAILESILRVRLPIPDAIRKSQSSGSKIAAMKILLGVLEDDVLHVDIGLSEVDPRRLAAGEWDELVFVGETLCWLAHNQGIHSTARPQTIPPESLATSSNKNTSVYSGFSKADTSLSSATTVSWDEHPLDSDVSIPALTSASRTPRCIHEVEMRSFSFETQSVDMDISGEYCDCSTLPHPRPALPSTSTQEASDDALSLDVAQPPVRYDGQIGLADDDVPAFEASRERSREQSMSRGHSRREVSPRHWSSDFHNPSGHLSSPEYRLLLLEERARLLEELAKLKTEARLPSPRAMSS